MSSYIPVYCCSCCYVACITLKKNAINILEGLDVVMQIVKPEDIVTWVSKCHVKKVIKSGGPQGGSRIDLEKFAYGTEKPLPDDLRGPRTHVSIAAENSFCCL